MLYRFYLHGKICRAIITNGKISYNPHLGPLAIHLLYDCFRRSESCSSPSTTRCHHIIAARMSVGLESIDDKHTTNFPQLQKRQLLRQTRRVVTRHLDQHCFGTRFSNSVLLSIVAFYGSISVFVTFQMNQYTEISNVNDNNYLSNCISKGNYHQWRSDYSSWCVSNR